MDCKILRTASGVFTAAAHSMTTGAAHSMTIGAAHSMTVEQSVIAVAAAKTEHRMSSFGKASSKYPPV